MIKKETDELDKYWTDLIFSISGGNATEMVQLKKFDIFDLFDYIYNKQNA